MLDAAVADLAASGLSAAGAAGDVRSPPDCVRWVADATARWGGLDILVNCAAGNFLASADGLSANGFKTVMDIDAGGTFAASTAALPALRSSPAPVVINISATLHYGATWWQAHACAAKAAVDALTRSLALEWGEYGVRVAGIAPGPIAGTAGLSKLAGDGGAGDVEAAVASLVPLGRLGERWDIAITAVWLASAGARFVSGDTLVVDGGAWLWRPPAVPRGVVAAVSRGVEAASRARGVANSVGGGGGSARGVQARL